MPHDPTVGLAVLVDNEDVDVAAYKAIVVEDVFFDFLLCLRVVEACVEVVAEAEQRIGFVRENAIAYPKQVLDGNIDHPLYEGRSRVMLIDVENHHQLICLPYAIVSLHSARFR